MGGALLVSVVTLGICRPGAAAGEVVVVTPDRDLPDTTTVQVSGSGFTPYSYVFLRQCADVNGVERCSAVLGPDRRTNASGAFPAGALTVHATFRSDGVTVECRSGCELRARDIHGRIGSGSLGFRRHTK